jgi:hypothetical protein
MVSGAGRWGKGQDVLGCGINGGPMHQLQMTAVRMYLRIYLAVQSILRHLLLEIIILRIEV